jgi:hypothetical protein
MVMPLYAVLAREYFRRAHHGNGVRRGRGGRKPRDGARAMVWPRMTGPPTLIDWAE